jgi:hypothetical protein
MCFKVFYSLQAFKNDKNSLSGKKVKTTEDE